MSTETTCSANVPPGFSLPLTLGATQVGSYLSAAFYGVVTAQTYTYFSTVRAQPDSRALRALVAFVWIFETLHTAFIIQSMYQIVVIDFGTIHGLAFIPFTLAFSIFLSTVISFAVQCYFAWRIKVLSGRWEVPVLCWILNLARSTDGIVVTAKLIQIPSLEEFNARYPWPVTFGMGIGTFADLLVAFGMCYYLWQYKKETQVERTDRILDRLMKFSIETGMLTAVLCLVTLILYVGVPHKSLWLGVYVVLAKSYSNAFMAALNARNNMKRETTAVISGQMMSHETSSRGGNTQTGRGQVLSVTSMRSKGGAQHLNSHHGSHKPGTLAVEMATFTTIYGDDMKLTEPHRDDGYAV